MRRCCVLLPTYCEARHLATLLPSVFDQQANIPDYELWVLVVDDNSPDGTHVIVESLMASHPRLRLLQGPKRGLGEAYQRGFAHARASLAPELLVQMDADWQHAPAALPALIAACRSPVDVVVGSRFAPGGSTPAFSARRRATSRFGNWVLRRWAGLPPLHDYTSGFRCIRAELAWQCVERCRRDGFARRGYAFQSSLIAEALLGGAGIVEIPICFGARRGGQSKLGIRDYWEFGANLRRLRKRARSNSQAAAVGGTH